MVSSLNDESERFALEVYDLKEIYSPFVDIDKDLVEIETPYRKNDLSKIEQMARTFVTTSSKTVKNNALLALKLKLKDCLFKQNFELKDVLLEDDRVIASLEYPDGKHKLLLAKLSEINDLYEV